MSINPLAYTEKVVRSFLRYQLTSYPFADERLNARMRELLSLEETRDTPLFRGPYVSLSRAFESGVSVKELIADGVLHPHLERLISFPHLYGHQEKAIRAISKGQTTLISTGTGSGKSECFLYPIISRCFELREKEAPPGICAVVVYPMNSLAEDQLGRLRELLAGSGITFGMYVGKTPERQADVAGKSLETGAASHADYISLVEELRAKGDPAVVHPLEERCSREAMRRKGEQPRILLTNVQQLELLLTRHRDVELFDGTRLDYLVFDEAHTFRGTRGAESACLVRRLRSFCGRDRNDTVCIATSATIVDEANPDAAREFAGRFFGVDADRIATVNERYEPDVWAVERTLPPSPDNADQALEQVRRAVDAPDAGESLRAAWTALTGGKLGPGDVGEELHAQLAANELLYQAAQLLERPRPLVELVAELGENIGRPVTETELILWLTLGAAARLEGRPLVRPVVHGFVRGIPGAVVTFDPDSDVPELHLSAHEDDGEDDECLRMKLYTCTTCGQHYFEHSLADFDFSGKSPGGGNALEEGGRWWEPEDTTHGGTRLLLVDRLISQDEDETPESTKLEALYICRGCGAAHSETGPVCRNCGAKGDLLELHATRQPKHPEQLSTCVCCGAFGRTFAGRFREPAKPVRATNVADVHVLAQDMVHHADRERLLVFADNRQDAAFQAGWMRDHARRFRLRSLMLDALSGGPLSIGDLTHELDDMLEANDALSRALVREVWDVVPKGDSGRRHREHRLHFLRIQVLLELTMGERQRIGLEPWGKIKVNYRGLDESDDFIQKWARQLKLPADEILGGVEGILDYLRRRKYLFDETSRVFSRTWHSGEREIQNGYLPELKGIPKGVKLRRASDDDPNWVSQWLSEGHLTTIKEVAGKWGVESQRLDNFVEDLWRYLSHPDRELMTSVTLQGSKGKSLPNCHGTHQVNGAAVVIAANASGAYRCRTCRRRSIRRSPHMKCLAWHCSGELEYLPEEQDNYDLQLVEQQYTMLQPREHTAMVPTAEREKLEQMFKSDSRAVNALVCTQTLELGVDIGALDAVLMRNVPPRPSNYWQRVGRAGRRHRMAVNLTYCRQTNHDRAYFAEPIKMLGGRVTPPSFNLSNELMVAKHVHATVLTSLHQLTRDGSALAEADRRCVKEILDDCFPRFVSAYLFDAGGLRRVSAYDVSRLTEAIDIARPMIDQAVRQAFTQGWPDRDRALVEESTLSAHVNRMTESLQAVVTRLFRRVRWAHQQMERLEKVRGDYATLNDEQEAFYQRCKNFIRKMKGTSRRQRRDAEGVDDIVTLGVLAAEGFLPGYGLETGSVLGMAQVPRSVIGLQDFDLPRPPAVALREYVPGNLIYANGQRFVARRYYRDVGEQRADSLTFEVSSAREAIHEAHGQAKGNSDSTEVTSIPICDVLLLHQSRISDEEENRFQMGVAIYGRELGQHSGGRAYRWGGKAVTLRKGVRMQLVNVGSNFAIQSRSEFGYPVCIVCGQSVSPFSSERQRTDFRQKHEEQCGWRSDNVAFHADLAIDTFTIQACTDREEAYSLAEALRFAAAELLEMELEDLHVLVVGHHDRDEVDAHIYDPMPGGSGLLEQVCERFGEIVHYAGKLAANCPGECQASCIDCFQNYRNAFYHQHLDRHRMIERLGELGDALIPQHEIVPCHPSIEPDPDKNPVNAAERKLRDMLNLAGFPEGRWQEQRLLRKPLSSTTPDVTFDDPDDEDVKVFVYLDGLSKHIHGNPETQERDRQIRGQLSGEGHTVIEITAHDLGDENQMARHFRKLALTLLDRKVAKAIANQPEQWFLGHDGEDGRKPSTTSEPPRMIEIPFYPTLKIACGTFRSAWAEYEPEMISIPEVRPNLDPKRHFVVQTQGDSMDGGNVPIKDGDYVLLEWQDPDHAGSLSGYGRPWAVEYRDQDGDTAYALKIIKKDPDGSYRLVSRNPKYDDIPVDMDTTVPIARLLEVLPQGSIP